VKSLFENPWPLPGKLHVYALPDDRLRDELVGYQSILADVDYCVPQPRAFLHATLQSYPVFHGQVEPSGLVALKEELARRAALIEPLALQFGGPVVHDKAITADAAITDEWTRLIEAVRAAAVGTICDEDDLGAPPFGPHVSLGYARADGSTEDLEKALVELGRPLDRELMVDRIHLLAVNQHPVDGIFDWEPIESFPLGG
jgi:2'-5' RNA ligase